MRKVSKLVEHGFKDGGIFQGVVGNLKSSFFPETPENCVLEMVKDEQAMDEFNELVCATFDMKGKAKEFYKKVLWREAQGSKPRMFHWAARKEGQMVSALSTLIEGEIVSFWNGASLPKFRCQGICTALGNLASNDALSKGCQLGISYLMAEGLALGICKKFGYQEKWQFRTFLSP